MGKYKKTNFFQVYRKAIEKLNTRGKKISYSTKWLYIQLCALEHKYTGKKEDFFFRSIRDIQGDTGMGTAEIVRGVKNLQELQLIQSWQLHFRDRKTGKKTRKHITAFRILEE